MSSDGPTPRFVARITLAPAIGTVAALWIFFLAQDIRAGEEPIGGQLAVSGGDPGLDLEIGRALFERMWVSAPASTKSTDGLGPLYNARSCSACHPASRRLPVADGGWAVPTAIIFKLLGAPAGDPSYGTQLQTAAVQGLAAEGRVAIDYRERPVTLADGVVVHLRKPSYHVADLSYGPLDPAMELSPRVPPLLAGVGLLERIDDAAILDWADEHDGDGDGISGRANRLADCAAPGPCVGRFGWKAGAATIAAQDALAFSVDIGMSTPLQAAPWGDCTVRQRGCVAGPHGADPATAETEIESRLAQLLDDFVRSKPAPARSDLSPLAATGESIFAGVGCAACHRPSFQILAADGSPRTITPYSDLLLHDLGRGLSGGDRYAREWRTAPLWGLSASERRPGPKAYLHDGRARSLEEAILWHGGEATQVIAAFKVLTAGERQALLEFLSSR